MRNTVSFLEAERLFHAQEALQYSESNPTEVTDVYWLYATRQIGNYPDATQRSGKWLVFATVDQIDEVWKKIKKATEEGKLGGSSKVSTNMPKANASNVDEKVICVYTYDWTDEEDVTRVREELRKMGITRNIPYKSDDDTRQGKYRAAGDTNISKRYE